MYKRQEFFAPGFGDLIAEVPADKVGKLAVTYTVIGEVTDDGIFSYGNTKVTLKEACLLYTSRCV